MKFCGFRIPIGQIRDMEYIKAETGMSKSLMARQGLSLFINDYFQKEKVKQDQIQENNRRRATVHGGGGISLDGW